MATREKILNTISAHLGELQKSFNVSRIGLFGSTARGEEHQGSDIDLLVEFSKPVGFVSFIRLENRLRELLNAPVDLVTPKALKPRIGKNILQEVIYAR